MVLCGRGTVWYRLVGVNLAQSNFTEDASTVIDSLAQFVTLSVELSPFVQAVAANSSAASGACQPCPESCISVPASPEMICCDTADVPCPSIGQRSLLTSGSGLGVGVGLGLGLGLGLGPQPLTHTA